MRFISDALLRLMTWVREEKGQTLVEYALIVGLVSIAAIVVMILMGSEIGNVFDAITDELANVLLAGTLGVPWRQRQWAAGAGPSGSVTCPLGPAAGTWRPDMKACIQWLARASRRIRGEHGQTLLEYALIVGFIGIGTIAAMWALGPAIGSAFEGITGRLANATFF
jgi:pilus assembly protein Flp/PilA